MRNYASAIKSAVTVPDVLNAYGFAARLGRRIPCPLHNGKDNNFAFDESRYKCFVCGASGDVITFVEQYFHLSFGDAVSKLNADFGIGLPIGEKIDYRKQQEIGRRLYERNRQKRAEERERKKVQADYWKALDEWIKLDKIRREMAPRSPEEPLNPLFAMAMHKIDLAEENLNQAEVARYEYEHRAR